MKQITQTQRSGHVRVEEVPPPALQDGGVLVRTAYSLISAGTERAKIELAQKSLVGKARARPEQARQVLEVLRQQGPLTTYRKVMNRLNALQPLGYSCSGTVIAVGSEAEDFRVGDLVACGGAGYANHAEINFVPKNLCVKIPSGLELEDAAFATVGAIALQGVRQAEVRLGEVVAVVGLGLVGLLTVQLLKAAGCAVIGMDINPSRCELARELGCDAAASVATELKALVASVSAGYGCDAVILTAATSSSAPVHLAGELARDRGRVVVVGAVGMNVPRQLYYEKELDLRLSRSYGPGRYDPEYEEKGHDYPIGYVRWTEKRNMQAFLDMVAQAKVNVRSLITHRFRIEEAPDAYELIAHGKEPHLGVLLEYGSGQSQAGISKEIHIVRSDTAKESVQSGAINIGMIGAGNFAQGTLLPALKATKRVRFHTVVTASGLSAKSVARRFGFSTAASDPAAVIENPDIQAVVIATRHDSHAPLVLEALRAGKHVFVEKPLAIDFDQLREVRETYLEIVRQSGKKDPPLLMVGFNRRFAPATEEVKKFFAETGESLAILIRVNAGYLPLDHWLHDRVIGGGRFVGEGCHFVDLLLYLIPNEPVEIYAHALPNEGKYRQDNLSVQVRFANGSIGTIQYLANGDSRVGKEYIEISGGGATAIIHDFRRWVLAKHGKVRRYGHRWSKQDKGHFAEMRAFVEAVYGNGGSPTPFEEVHMSTLTTFKAVESLEVGKPLFLAS